MPLDAAEPGEASPTQGKSVPVPSGDLGPRDTCPPPVATDDALPPGRGCDPRAPTWTTQPAVLSESVSTGTEAGLWPPVHPPVPPGSGQPQSGNEVSLKAPVVMAQSRGGAIGSPLRAGARGRPQMWPSEMYFFFPFLFWSSQCFDTKIWISNPSGTS